ncbi:MAG: T9SS C-terminal target domain-containing protein [Flavobacteriia bacterium]|nr:T9SS C-terminal target domain-containing protein [Flavobacteriia bacterium]
MTKTLLFLLFPTFIFTQSLIGVNKSPNISILKAGCSPPKYSTMMELNNVRALIHTAGNMWQKPGQNLSQYEVPKNSGIMALFTSALWLGGTDVNGQLKLAALRYREGQDYWTGPLTKGLATVTSEICLQYDRHFVTSQDVIKEFDAWYEAGLSDQQKGTSTQSVLFPNYTIPEMIKNWPAHGEVSLGQDYYLAPFFDRDMDGVYNWEQGDYHWYDFKKDKQCSVDRKVSLYGDQNFWWVMNDKGNIHTETGADPIGMEIRAQAFVFTTNDEINNMTFYNYELINRGTQTLTNTYFGYFVDGALGDPFDDFVGCDVNRGLGYLYNGDDYDGDNLGFFGYGETPPAVGVDFFEGPFQDNDAIDNSIGIGENQALNGIGYGDGVIDNERFGMRRFLYYVNTGSTANINTTDPISASDYYNYLRGFWKDNTPFYYGGSGHYSDPEANTNVACSFLFPGDTDPLGWGTSGFPQSPWTEESSGNTPYDRRFLQSAGPFVLKPGAVNNITVGVVFARANSGTPYASVEILKRADDKAQSLFENCFKVLEGPHAPILKAQELSNEIILTIQNPVNSNNYLERYEEIDPTIVPEDPNADKSYRFQGYLIYQLKDESVSVSDIEDLAKARLVSQCDIKDDISRIVNFEFDQDLQASIPVEKVNGVNKGIQHSFRITEDQFSSGTRTLVNFKKYYFVALSYAYNSYKNFVPDDPNFLDGQKKKFIASRKAAFGEIIPIEVIPHNPIPENGGTNYFLNYGESPEVTRLDGRGNGGLAVYLTQKSIDEICSNGKVNEITYKKSSSPIEIKVIDPLNVVSGVFELKFYGYVNEQSNEAINGKGIDSAKWVIYRYDKADGKLLDSIFSEISISNEDDFSRIENPNLFTYVNPPLNNENEQLIPEWGISVQISQSFFVKVAETSTDGERRYTYPLEAKLIYKDSTKNWLDFVNDENGFNVKNWIRSGNYVPGENDCLDPEPYINPCLYPDEDGIDIDDNYSKLLDGGIAPFRLVGYLGPFMPIKNPASSGSMTQARQKNSLMRLPNVDIYFTNDKSKWTRCPVIELGFYTTLNIGDAPPGTIRRSGSVDKEGKPDGTGNGMGWFPGYAIDVETGVRLNMAFGENSFLGEENGSDMLWNPTENMGDPAQAPLLGGQHAIYVFGYNISGEIQSDKNCPYYNPNSTNDWLYNKYTQGDNSDYLDLFSNLSWVVNPILKSGHSVLESDAVIHVRVQKEYNDYIATGKNNGKPMYSWDMTTLMTQLGSLDQLKSALDLINVVPNPYYAYSEYERSKIDSRIKIINLPEKCHIKIFNVSGKLIKTYKKDSPLTYQDWNLVNEKSVPIASGIYLIHVHVPDVGDRILKAYISQRAPDLHGY